jgi:hypothetical protein
VSAAGTQKQSQIRSSPGIDLKYLPSSYLTNNKAYQPQHGSSTLDINVVKKPLH